MCAFFLKNICLFDGLFFVEGTLLLRVPRHPPTQKNTTSLFLQFKYFCFPVRGGSKDKLVEYVVDASYLL